MQRKSSDFSAPEIMRTVLLICFLLLWENPNTARAEVYKTIGADGRISYTDKPPDTFSADKTEKLKLQTYAGDPVVSSSNSAVKRVVIISAEWCGVCTRAKAYMRSHKIDFEEWDIDKSNFARAKMKEHGAKGVPLILVGKQKMVGFSEATLEEMLKKATQAR